MEDLSQSRILIIDDKKENVMLLESMMADEGFTNIIGATDSRDAKDLYEGFEPDIVLLDIHMPFMDGFDVMAQLSQLVKDDYLPVLVLTAMRDDDIRIRALTSGAKDFITKPFNQSEVISRIRNFLEIRLLHKQVKQQKNLLAKQNVILEEKVKERTRELHDTRLEIIRRLGLAAEYRDNETGFHIIRMSKMSQSLALARGLSPEEADIILHASPMHDVGKIGIPDKILLKPAKLTDDEWIIMKTHTTIGGKMLDGHSSVLLSSAREIALTHHERWDGTGYPNGLKGAEIPVAGRICALADVLDALTSERPYKKPWPLDRCLEYIQRVSGQHFDPELVELLIENIDRMVSIQREYLEPEEPEGNSE